MFVCNCKSVTENDIEKLKNQGIGSVRELGSKCGAGTDCGSCVFWLEKMLQTKEETPANDSLAREAETANPGSSE